MLIHNSITCYAICIGNHMGLSAIWKKIARQFRPVVSVIKKKLHSKTCGYLLIIRHLASKN